MPCERAKSFIRDQIDILPTYPSSLELIICPSFIALEDACTQTHGTRLHIGAQNCSEYQMGPYTGEVDAASLASIGCKYAIVGHSERRLHYHETDEIIGNKIARLLENNITPIVCVGEQALSTSIKQTQEALHKQLVPIIANSNQAKTILVAYEPIWAIGTGITPTMDHLKTIVGWLAHTLATTLPGTSVYVLYGGSVSETNAAEILAIPGLDGLLVGNASLDFQKFQNIVSLSCSSRLSTK